VAGIWSRSAFIVAHFQRAFVLSCQIADLKVTTRPIRIGPTVNRER
jgi:hypothetical protein